MIHLNKKLLFLLLINFAGLSAFSPAYANLIRNSSFETGENSVITDWRTQVWNKGHAEFTVTDHIAHSGSRSLVIINKEKAKASCSQVVDIDMDRTYRFSCWIKTEFTGAEPDAGSAYLSVNNNPETSLRITGFNTVWKQAELFIKLEATGDAEINKLMNTIVLHLILINNSGQSAGVAYFDDAVLEEVAVVPENAVIARINAGVPPMAAGKSKEEKTDTAARERERQTRTVVVLLVAVIALVISGRAVYRVFRKRVKIRVLSHNKHVGGRYVFRFPAIKQHRLNRIRYRKYRRSLRGKAQNGKQEKGFREKQ